MSFGIPVRNGLGLGLLASTSLSTVNGSPFSPLSLFAANEPGGWYDPSDLTTLYQDSAGTTPVTAVEQPVGLVLDKSRGLVLGSELVTNGTFDSGAAGWSGGTPDISGGALIWSAVANNTGIFQSNAAYSGGVYEITVVVSSITSGAVTATLGVGVPSALNCINITSAGTHTFKQGNAAGDTFLRVYSVGASTTATIDSVSIKRVAGAHLTQSTSTARPVLSARVNLLTQTEAFDVGPWVKSGLVTAGMANVTTAPDGTMTADQFVESAATGTHIVYANVSGSKSDIISVAAKANTRSVVTVGCNDNSSGNWAAAAFNLSSGTAATAQAGGTFSGTSSITSLGNGWYRCTLAVTSSGSAVGQVKYGVANSATPTFGSWADYSYTGDGTSGIYIWGADLRVANDGVNLPVYQRVGVGTPTTTNPPVTGTSDYDTTGFPLYLRFDGTDDFMVSPTITPGIDKAQVFAGVRKLSDAVGFGVVSELGNLSTQVVGTFTVHAPATQNASSYMFASRGTADRAIETPSSFTAPITNVLTGLGDISGDVCLVRANGLVQGNNTGDQGTGNYGNYPLYVGARAGTSLRFNGRLYPLIVRFGATLTDTQIAQTESYVSTQMGGGYVPVGYDYLVDANGDQLTDASGNALYTIPLYS